MTKNEMKNDILFMRNSFTSVEPWGIPLVKKQEIPNNNILLVACSDTRANDCEINKKKRLTLLCRRLPIYGYL